MSTYFGDSTKQEVWETLRTLNDAWTKGNPKELRNYFHKDMVAITATDLKRLEGRDACIDAWNKFVQATKIHYWKEIEPQIQLYGGNTAVVTYYFDMSFDMGGKTIKMGGRDMFVFVKEGGQWWAVADQFSAYPR